MLMSHRTAVAAIPALALWLTPLSGLAGGYAIPNENARDLALSQSAEAAQNGPEAAYQNPAALAGLEGLSASVSVEGLYNVTRWSDPNLGTASLDPKWNTPPQAAVSWGHKLPNDMAYGLGVSLVVPGGGSLNWPANWPGSQRIQTVTQEVYLVEASLAFQPVSFIKLGGGLLYYRATEDLTQKLGFVSSTGDAELGLAGGAVSYSAAAQVDVPGVPLSLAFTYFHKGDLNLRGNAHFSGIPASFQALLQDQGVGEHVVVPNNIFVGAAYKVQKNLQVMATWNLERWINYNQDQFIGDLGFTVTVPRHYVNAYVFRVGGEWTDALIPGLTLRLGGLRSISPQPTDTLSPSLTDGNSWALSAGAGYQIFKALRVDLGYQHGFFDAVTATGPEAFPGTYKTSVDLVSLGLTFHHDFGAGAK